MKLTLIIASLLLAITSCHQIDDLELVKENETLKMEIEELYVKVSATEAQLLNINSELAKCRGIDSTATMQNN